MKALLIKGKISKVWEKNGPDFKAVLNGSLPKTLRGNDQQDHRETLPVFVFHSVEPIRFEAQLRYLAENGYRSLDSRKFLEKCLAGSSKDSKNVVLTFDDATGSAWTVAYPLLRKYGFRGILFAIPGLIPDEGILSPNLKDVWDGKAEVEQLKSREVEQPLCSWEELIIMERNGVFDIQSHSLTHARIFTSPQVIDFVNPWFDTYFYHNVNLPIFRDESVESPRRMIRYGRPIYISKSRLSGQNRFMENQEVTERLESHVMEKGGEKYFNRPEWRLELEKLHRDLIKKSRKVFEFESQDETEAAVMKEMVLSKKILEERLDKQIRHLCYPWYQGSPFSDRIAGESGYQAVYYGLEYEESNKGNTAPIQVRRISEEYLHCLPGKGQISVGRVWVDKLYKSFRRMRLV
jgi:peptidoglycan/xylan/chitin deacetylase (PgdA/CDA1 family)